jgi:hypothetical protein
MKNTKRTHLAEKRPTSTKQIRANQKNAKKTKEPKTANGPTNPTNASLPSTSKLDKLLRYESQIQRDLHRAHLQLDRKRDKSKNQQPNGVAQPDGIESP